MDKLRIYFENQKDIIIRELSSAKCSVLIAVAWINFNEYGDVIASLLRKGVEVKIIINDDSNNSVYDKNIEQLQQIGLKLKKIRIPNGYMHHKFCIIDEKVCITGSFNWTKRASENNLEILIVSFNFTLISNLLHMFWGMWSLSIDKLIELKKLQGNKRYEKVCSYLCVLEPDIEKNLTIVDIYEIYDDFDFRWINNEFFDISVYNTLESIWNKYSDMEMEMYDYGEMSVDIKKKIEFEMSCEMRKYLSNIRKVDLNIPTIHAIGVYGYEMLNKHTCIRIIKVLWKEIYTDTYIRDEYHIGN